MATAAQDLPEHYSAFDDRNFQIGGRTLFFTIVIFSIIISVTLIFLLVRWLCRFRRALLPGSTRLTSAGPRSLYTGAPGEGECSICLGAFADGEKVLPECGHCYHHECVDRWLAGQSSCPLCRTDLRVDPVGPAVTVVVVARDGSTARRNRQSNCERRKMRVTEMMIEKITIVKNIVRSPIWKFRSSKAE